MKIRTQLLVFILGVVFIGFAAVMAISYFTSKRAVVAEVYEKAENIRQRHQEYLNGFFNAAAKVASGTAQAVVAHKDVSETLIHELLKNNLIWNPEIYGMTVLIEPKPSEIGKKLFAPYYFRHGQLLKYIPARPTFEFQEQDWYVDPKEASKPVWTEPYFDKGTKEIMATYSVPMYIGGKFTGVATVDIGMDKLAEKTEAIQVGRSGYAVLVSRNGTFLTHPHPQDYVLQRKIQDVAAEFKDPGFIDLAQGMIHGKSGALSVMDPFTKERSWATYGPIPSTGYSLVVFVQEDELLLSVNRLGRTILWVSLAVAALIVAAIIIISFRITRPIGALGESARKIAMGNLDIDIPCPSSASEITGLACDLDRMVKTIKRMYSAVSEEKDKFERVFSTMSDGVAATDAEWKVISFNAAASRMLGVEKDMNLLQHISKGFRSSFRLEDMLDYKKREKHFEMTRPESDQVGEMAFSARISTIVDADDRIASYVLTARDVTEEKREELNKSNLLSLISHKLRTPIAVLMGTVDLFKDGLYGDLSTKQADGIGKMASQAHKLQMLVDRLIGYVTLVGAEKLSCEETDVGAFIRDLVEKGRWESGGRAPKISFDIAADVGDWSLNKEHLRLSISELIENATKFNGRSDVEIKISVRRDAGRLIIELRDNGIGIAPLYHEKIFERFFQIDKDFTGNKEGIGIGLPLVKAFVEGCRGRISVDSREGEGSAFVMEFF